MTDKEAEPMLALLLGIALTWGATAQWPGFWRLPRRARYPLAALLSLTITSATLLCYPVFQGTV